MGKRKSSRKVQTRKGPPPLDKSFRCLFCQHPGTITVKFDKTNQIGRLDCKNCGQNFSATINNLSAPIDLYSEWIDAAAEVNKDSRGDGREKRQRRNRDSDEDSDQEPDAGDERRRLREGSEVVRRRERAALDEDDEDLPEA